MDHGHPFGPLAERRIEGLRGSAKQEELVEVHHIGGNLGDRRGVGVIGNDPLVGTRAVEAMVLEGQVQQVLELDPFSPIHLALSRVAALDKEGSRLDVGERVGRRLDVGPRGPGDCHFAPENLVDLAIRTGQLR